MKKAYVWMLAGAITCGLGSPTTAQNAAGNYEDLTKLLPAETFLWAATRNIEKGFPAIAPYLGEHPDRDFIRLLPSRARDLNRTNFIAALTAMGMKTDGPGAIGLMILQDQNGRNRVDDNTPLIILPIARQDVLETIIQGEERGDFPRENMGGITVAGSESSRANFAWTDKYFIYGSRPAIKLVAETFLGKHRAVAKAPPGDGLFLVHFNPGQFSGIFKEQISREAKSRDPENADALLPAARQSLAIMEACEGFTLFADLANNSLAFKGRLGFQNKPAVANLLSAKSEKLSILQCLPEDASLVAATCLTPELLPIWAGFMASFVDRHTQVIAAISHLARPIAGRPIAFAFTKGSFHELPNLLCVADCRDTDAAQAGYEALSSFFMGEGRRPFTVSQADGAEFRSFKSRSDFTTCAARADKRLFYATDLDAVQKAVARSAHGGGGSAENIAEITELLGPEEKSSLLVFADFPRIFSSMDAARRDRMVKSQQQSCISNMREAERLANLYQEKLSRAPADLPGMLPALAEVGVKNPNLRTNCVSDAKAQLTLDPATRKATCPRHGTINQPLAYVSPEMAGPHRHRPQGFDFLGRGAIRLNNGSNGFDIEGKLKLNAPKPPDLSYACINNLRQIESAKDQWALEMGQTNNAQVNIDAVNKYLKGNTMPICPAGGRYTYNPIGINAECSVPGHKLQ